MSSRDYPPPTIEYILLGLLHETPQHGYSLHKTLSEMDSLSRIWQVKRSKLYYLLTKLEDRGLIAGKHVPGQNRPSRDVYTLTEKGKKVFLEWVEAPIETARHVRLVILARLYFALSLGVETTNRLLANQKRVCQTWMDSLRAEKKVLQDPDLITEQVLSFRMGQIQAMLDWLESCQQRVQEGADLQPQDFHTP
jgi:DNA-binding PadR family transcriptional regulator